MNVGLTPEAARFRAAMMRAVRAFFDGRGYIEVETPVRIPAPAQEFAIDCPGSDGAFLRASPELQMKRLMVAGFEKIYQIGPCFRSLECGKRHNPEFSMLEWYSAGGDCNSILEEARELLNALVDTLPLSGEVVSLLKTPWREITVAEAFAEYAGWNPLEDWDQDRFDTDMAMKVEPNLPRDAPCVLRDYPAPAASLARLNPENGAAERWELYVDGLELANAYSELCDHAIQRRRFEAEADMRRAAGKTVYPMDEDFFADLRRGMPACGGIALGIDRLAMLLTGKRDIADVRLFCQRPGYLF